MPVTPAELIAAEAILARAKAAGIQAGRIRRLHLSCRSNPCRKERARLLIFHQACHAFQTGYDSMQVAKSSSSQDELFRVGCRQEPSQVPHMGAEWQRPWGPFRSSRSDPLISQRARSVRREVEIRWPIPLFEQFESMC